MTESTPITANPPLEGLERAAECLRSLAHPDRLRIVQLLLTGERTVGEVAERCHIPPSVASEQLRRMSDRGLLKRDRRGRNTFYSIAEPELEGLMACIGSRFGQCKLQENPS